MASTERERKSTIPVTRASSDRHSQVKWASGLNILAGLWLMASPWVLAYVDISEPARWNSLLVGMAVVVIAGIRFFLGYQAGWLSWANVVLGFWLTMAPFILQYETVTGFWNSVLVGLLIAFLGAWSALASYTHSASRR
jgi:hypothetical protein